MIVIGYDKNTSLHLADVRANYPGKIFAKESSAMIEDGTRKWVTYETLVVDGEDFEQIGEAFEANKNVNKVNIGNALVTCMSQREFVDFAVQWIESKRSD
ncbi:MAG: AAC(3) family N-acetyltransferase [Mobilitalea sp.]